MNLEAIEYRGELVALVGAERFHIVAPWLLKRAAADPDLRFVTLMCVCRRQALEHGLTGHVAGEVLELWVRNTLIDERELTFHVHLSDAALARRLNVPTEQLAAARTEFNTRELRA